MAPEEKSRIEIADFGLGLFEQTGLAILVYVNTERCCAKELAMLPRQTCPEHRHPRIDRTNPGKEETFRCRWGMVYLYVPGRKIAKPKAVAPAGRERTYTVWHEIVLRPGEQYALAPNTLHWFQAGPRGAAVSEFSTKSLDESDIFTDREIQRITKIRKKCAHVCTPEPSALKNIYDLSQLDWKLSGWCPYLWEAAGILDARVAEVPEIPARVPGSVQLALREAGIIPDWNAGLNERACEWVENRHWIYRTAIPDEWIEKGRTIRLRCLGLDYAGRVFLNRKCVGEFRGTHVPHSFDLTPHLADTQNTLEIVFEVAPRWLGQFGHSSIMREWKVRFNYTWDWIPRLVQIGIWDSIRLEVADGREIDDFRCSADADVATGGGILHLGGTVHHADGDQVRLVLARDAGAGPCACPGRATRDRGRSPAAPTCHRAGTVVREEIVPASQFNAKGIHWFGLPVELWWPNGEGSQPLYVVRCELLDAAGADLDSVERGVGFRNVSWKQCEGAPAGADPWICVVNGRPIFLQGVNFPPVRPNYADVTEAGYRKRLVLYRDLGANAFRINACQFLEKETFYDICDELGLLVWQEFPLTSSGIENMPPDDADSIAAMAAIAESFVVRRRHHASLILWSGGNELLDKNWRPIGTEHPMLARLQQVVKEHDPTRRFIPASPSGPRFTAAAEDYGKGLHWDVHGQWTAGDLATTEKYWRGDDALFRSEIASPGCESLELIRKYRGECEPMPVDASNIFWRRPVQWWLQADQFKAEAGREPASIEEYVNWSQRRQADALVIAVKACKDRFPRCGGALLWMGHDCFPCPTNTAIIDFNGDPKPAALALSKVWKSKTSAWEARA